MASVPSAAVSPTSRDSAVTLNATPDMEMVFVFLSTDVTRPKVGEAIVTEENKTPDSNHSKHKRLNFALN